LRKNWEFQKIITHGQKVGNRNFTIFARKNQLNNCQFGISIPQHFVKKAVQRNYYKRQIRNMLIQHLKKHNDSCQITANHRHHNLVIIIRPAYLDQDFATNCESLFQLLMLAYLKNSNQNDK
jgi:ribonuclease P protein component